MNGLQEAVVAVIVLAAVAWLVRRVLRKGANPCEQCGLAATARGKVKPGRRDAKTP